MHGDVPRNTYYTNNTFPKDEPLWMLLITSGNRDKKHTVYTNYPSMFSIIQNTWSIPTFNNSNRDHIYIYITIPVRWKQKYTWSHQEHAALTQKARRCPQRCIMSPSTCVGFSKLELASTGCANWVMVYNVEHHDAEPHYSRIHCFPQLTRS